MKKKFNPEKQYRCTIIRSRSTTLLDDLLPYYAKIITDICPSTKEDFVSYFNEKIALHLQSPTKKTIANHRTEIAGKLFGMWRKDEDGIVHASDRADRLIRNGDNPQFFKDIASRIQFPNGMDKMQTVIDRINHSISIRPIPFLLKTMLVAEREDILLTIGEIAYYILNSLEVLQGRIAPELVVDKIAKHRKKNEVNEVSLPGKGRSYNKQHIRELINIMELANLIRLQKHVGSTKVAALNRKELPIVRHLANKALKKPTFDVYSYNLDGSDSSIAERRKTFYYNWSRYYSSSDDTVLSFSPTSLESLDDIQMVSYPQHRMKYSQNDALSTGVEGELLVLEKEKERVRQFNKRLVNRVIYFGNQRGLGYDIASIKANNQDNAEHAIYIEVKSTKRVTKPESSFADSFRLTRNEWTAAHQHRENYFIYRVYLTSNGIFVLVLNNPITNAENGSISVTPTEYLVEFEAKMEDLQKW